MPNKKIYFQYQNESTFLQIKRVREKLGFEQEDNRFKFDDVLLVYDICRFEKVIKSIDLCETVILLKDVT